MAFWASSGRAKSRSSFSPYSSSLHTFLCFSRCRALKCFLLIYRKERNPSIGPSLNRGAPQLPNQSTTSSRGNPRDHAIPVITENSIRPAVSSHPQRPAPGQNCKSPVLGELSQGAVRDDLIYQERWDRRPALTTNRNTTLDSGECKSYLLRLVLPWAPK